MNLRRTIERMLVDKLNVKKCSRVIIDINGNIKTVTTITDEITNKVDNNCRNDWEKSRSQSSTF